MECEKYNKEKRRGSPSRMTLSLLLALALILVVVRVGPVLLLKENLPPPHRYLLLIAHPDDESMFFGPCLDKMEGLVVYVATLGDRGGDPEVRKREIERVCRESGVEVYFGNGRDGSFEPLEMVQSVILTFISTRRTAILTFDGRGVSGHVDHIKCNKIGRMVSRSVRCGLYTLRSVGVLSKYLMYVGRGGYVVKGRGMEARRRMLKYRSQMVWFRYGYVAMASYMDVCEISKAERHRE